MISLVPVAVASMLATLAATAPEPPLDPPPESSDGADYVAERADSLDDGNLEWSVGAAGRPGGAPRRRRGVSFSTDSLTGRLRDGDDDPLSGGTLGVRAWVARTGTAGCRHAGGAASCWVPPRSRGARSPRIAVAAHRPAAARAMARGCGARARGASRASSDASRAGRSAPRCCVAAARSPARSAARRTGCRRASATTATAVRVELAVDHAGAGAQRDG